MRKPARLSHLPDRLGRASVQPRLAQPDAPGTYHQRRDAEQPWRRLYKTARWQKLVDEIRVRDGFTCRQTGVALVGRFPAPNSPVVDHIIPHRGDLDLFWDKSNLQLVSKAYHDGEKQRQERASRR